MRARSATFGRRNVGIPGFTCANPSGAFYLFARVEGDAEELAHRLLEEAGVACLAGSAFGAAGAGFLRFSYATSEETLTEALRRMRDFLG